MTIKSLLINHDVILFDCLKQIEKNQCGFVVITDEKNVLKGTLTDGDIRRLLIKRRDIMSPIAGMYNSDYIYAQNDASFADIARMFLESAVTYLPVVDNGHRLYDIIKKEDFYAAALQDKEFNFGGKRSFERDGVKDIHVRPWGFYKSTFINKYSQSKILFVGPLQELSLQKHIKREEHWVVAKGNGLVTIGETVKKAGAGNYFFIPKGCKHRLKNTSTKFNLIVLEVQLGSYFGEDDLIRYDDIYGRN